MAIAAALAVPLFWTSGIARAAWWARGDSIESVRRAAAIDPGEISYWLAIARATNNLPGDESASALAKAAAIDPLDSRAPILLGLRAEHRGDRAEAEKQLLRAAQIDRTFEPRWALVNHYFRRGDKPNFWRWAREAVAMSHDDRLELVFQLCSMITEDDAETIRELKFPSLRLQTAYMRYLVNDGRMVSAEQFALALVPYVESEEDVNALVEFCSRALSLKRVAPAVTVWNQLASRGRIPFDPLEQGNDRVVTRPAFDAAPTGRGFDWTASDAVRSYVTPRQDLRIHLSFDGKQPESIDVLRQLVPAKPGRTYRIEWGYRTADIAPNSGLYWQAFDAATETPLIAAPVHLSSDKLAIASSEFTVPAASNGLIRLVLRYQRELGTTRILGELDLTGIRISGRS